MSNNLKPNQRLYLISLVAASGSEVYKYRSVNIEATDRRQLEKLGLVDKGSKEGRSFLIELTDKGWAYVRDDLASEPPRGSASKTLYAILNRLKSYLDHNRLSLAEVFAEHYWPTDTDISREVLDAYDTLASSRGDWVTLTALRSALPQCSRGRLDEALTTLARNSTIALAPNDNTVSLTQEDHEAAVLFGGERKHQIRRR